MSPRRIIPMLLLGLSALVPAGAQDRDGAGSGADRGHVAVVISLYGEYVAAVNITLPTGCSEDEAQQALQRVSAHTGWQFDTPVIRHETAAGGVDGCISIQSNVMGLWPIQPGGVEAVGPLMMALMQYPQAAVIYLGVDGGRDGGGRFENRYVRISWLHSGGVCSYQTWIKDRSFQSMEEMLEPDPEEGEPSGGAGGAALWVLLVLCAAGVGLLLYFVTARMIVKRR